jgi:hypothetical protein
VNYLTGVQGTSSGQASDHLGEAPAGQVQPSCRDLEERVQPCPDTSELLTQSLSGIPLDHELSGRTERRLPIVVVVRLAHCESAGIHAEEERTYTDNISTRGARLFSKNLWQLGDAVRVTPLEGDATCGKVVYCQRLPDDRYSIGVKFHGNYVKWTALQRYNCLIE